MQSRSLLLLNCAGLMLLSQAPLAGATSLYALEEPATTLVAPPNANPYITSLQYAYTGNAFVATTVTSTPQLCANTHTPLVTGTTLNPVYYSANGIGGATPKPFVFGASGATPSVSAMASGATGVQMASSMQFSGDATGSLVCYGLDANGTRRLTRDAFLDGFEPVAFNSSVALSVFHLPANQSDYYGYTIDVTIPPLPAGTDCSATGLDCNFVLQEGYDTSVFTTPTTGAWWIASAGTNTCPPSQAGNGGDINISFAAPVAPAAAATYHFVVCRNFASGVSALPSTGAPVAIAALFSPNDLEENKLDDNVAAGNNTLANNAPSIAQDATFNTFVASLAALNENNDSGVLTFNITDSDTAETPDHPLSAVVTLNLNGHSVPLIPNCTVTSGNGAANRQCTIDIPFNNPNWANWNSVVDASLQGQFNAFATDTTNGLYAPGVTASASIVVTDSAGKSSQPFPVNVHVHSTVNNPPVIAFGGSFPNVADPNDSNNNYPTYSCSVAAGGGAGGCGAAGRDATVTVTLPQSLTALPGPAAAFDELASQTTAVVPFSDPTFDQYTNVQCVQEQGSLIFSINPISGLAEGPSVAASGGSGSKYDMSFVIPAAPPTSAVSAICTLTITDAPTPFPNNEPVATTNKAFRLVINP